MSGFGSGFGHTKSISFGPSPLDAPAPHHSHHGILHNLLEDAINTAKGIPFGMVQTIEHPIRVAKAVGHSYADTYGHGFGHFWQQFKEHPLQPLLDAISVPLIAAGGLGFAVKGASAAAEVGRLGELGATYENAMLKASELTAAGKYAEADAMRASVARAPSLYKAAQRFQKGTSYTTKMVDTPIEGVALPKAYSSNLFRRFLSQKVYEAPVHALGKGLVKASDKSAGFGYEPGIGRQLGEALSEKGTGRRLFAKEIGKRAAATSHEAQIQATFLRKVAGASKRGELSAEDVAKAQKMLLERFDTSMWENGIKVSQAQAADLAGNRHFKYFAGTDTPSHLEVRYHPDYAPKDPVTGEPMTHQMLEEWNAKELANWNKEQPLPGWQHTHKAMTEAAYGPGRGWYWSGGGKPEHAVYNDENAGAILTGKKVVPPVKHELKTYDDLSNENAKNFIGNLKHRYALTNDPAKAAVDKEGNVRMVRTDAVDKYVDDVTGLAGLGAQIYKAPLTVWKAFILSMSPRYLVNNVVGNAGMLAAATNPVEFSRGVLQAIRSARGARAAARAEREMGNTLDGIAKRYLPDEIVSSHFGFLYHGALGLDQTIGFAQKGRVGRLRAGLYPLTEKVSYRATQRISILGALSRDPQVRELMRVLKKRGMSSEEAFQEATRRVMRDPRKSAAIEKRVTDWAGQYYHLNPLERAITAVVPFYNWDRHALRFGKEQVLSRPVQTAVLSQLGALGDKAATKELGNLPDFIKGAIPLHGGSKGVLGFLIGQNAVGRHKILLTSGYNPLAAAAEDAHAIAALVGARSPGEALGGQMNPLVAGAISGITGQSVFSGAKVHARGGPVGEALSEAFGQLPQAKVIKGELFGLPSTKTKRGEPTLYTKDLRQQVSSLFGLNTRDFSPKAAERLYREEHHIKKGRRRKKHDAFDAAGALKSQIKFK